MSIVSSLMVCKKWWISSQFTSVFCEASGSCLAHGKYLNVCKVCEALKEPHLPATFEIVSYNESCEPGPKVAAGNK